MKNDYNIKLEEMTRSLNTKLMIATRYIENHMRKFNLKRVFGILNKTK